MHTAALAVLPHLAVGALSLLCPFAVAKPLEAVLPHIPEAITIDISLRKVGSHTCAARDIAIHTNRGDADAGVALVWVCAYAHLVASEKSLAAV